MITSQSSRSAFLIFEKLCEEDGINFVESIIYGRENIFSTQTSCTKIHSVPGMPLFFPKPWLHS